MVLDTDGTIMLVKLDVWDWVVVTTIWVGVIKLELELTVVGVGVATDVESVVGGGGGGVEEVVTGLEVVAIAVLEGAAGPSQPDVVPHAVPPIQLEHPGYECAGLQSRLTTLDPSVSVICAWHRGRIAISNTTKLMREAIKPWTIKPPARRGKRVLSQITAFICDRIRACDELPALLGG
ncbi:hypothetical protein N431DRAFT_431640 [Stipitochalara longipes BDJ]|nr:hypothetical protein N431DRAFT_431640 [Stipitochalara longipes BDJ]